jgi:hypothetical protein
MDSDDGEAEPKVMIHRHPTDIHNRTRNCTGRPIVTPGNLDTIPERKSSPTGTRRVSVRNHRVHSEMWDDLAAVTNHRILKLKPQPPGWCSYLNPSFTVEAPEFSLEFSQEARRCQRAWLRTMNRTLGNKNRKYFAIKADFLTRQLAHSGMLIINGNVVAPHDWTSMEKELQFAGTSGQMAQPGELQAFPRCGPSRSHATEPAGVTG